VGLYFAQFFNKYKFSQKYKIYQSKIGAQMVFPSQCVIENFFIFKNVKHIPVGLALLTY
jgi:hypothetical protein